MEKNMKEIDFLSQSITVKLKVLFNNYEPESCYLALTRSLVLLGIACDYHQERQIKIFSIICKGTVPQVEDKLKKEIDKT